ncbi:MAG: GTPase Era [Caldilineae bacterium]|nr:GTPase Era [Chloroflexota bacterium]MCB9177459.1 GTPase Era [Caldilineae bacterium]
MIEQPQADPPPVSDAPEPEHRSEAAQDVTEAPFRPDPEPLPEDLDLVAKLFGRPAPNAAPGRHRAGFVALVGRPNVGKSTLLNAYVGEKVAIVSPKPQTTRRQILGIRSEPEAQVVFVDTPGLHDPAHALGRAMVKSANAALAGADVALWIVDVSRRPDEADAAIGRLLRQTGRPTILVLNKADRLRPEDIESHSQAWQALAEADDWVMTIATKRHNLEALWQALLLRLPEGPPLYPEDQLTDQTDRMFVAELVREAALRYLSEEVPHGIEVIIEDWSQREDGLLEVAAKIFVERAGHKGIVIGRGGSMLKQIGRAARLEMERALDCRVHLELFVAVRAGWRRDSGELKRLGFE